MIELFDVTAMRKCYLLLSMLFQCTAGPHDERRPLYEITLYRGTKLFSEPDRPIALDSQTVVGMGISIAERLNMCDVLRWHEVSNGSIERVCEPDVAMLISGDA